MEEVLQLIRYLKKQVDMCEFKDNIGHPLKNNIHYKNLIELLEEDK